MKKSVDIVYICTSCAHEEMRWMGRCPNCLEWNTLQEHKIPVAIAPSSFSADGEYATIASTQAETQDLSHISIETIKKISTGKREFDRTLGGGLVPGSTVLISGEPGIGKSTLLLETAGQAGTEQQPAVYISGEESPSQIAIRAERLGIRRNSFVQIIHEDTIEPVLATLEHIKPSLIVIDSIQTLYSRQMSSLMGSANQVRHVCMTMCEVAKRLQASVVFIAHITKDGSIAGPKVIEHIVDTVLVFEGSPSDLRFLRALKNRYGTVDELGMLRMTEKGLIEVLDPSSLFVRKEEGMLPLGAAISVFHEGSRSFPIELQALTVPSGAPGNRVFSEKIDARRVFRIAAVLERHAGTTFASYDIYVHTGGGMRIQETGIDLGIALALYSTQKNILLPANLCVFGELSLSGEVRPIAHTGRRLRTASELGITQAIIPKNSEDAQSLRIRSIEVRTISDAINAFCDLGQRVK